MSEPFIDKHALSTELYNVLREKYGSNSHRVCRPDREPSTTPVRSLKRLRNKSKKVRNFSMHVFSHVSPCHLHCTALLTLKKLLYKRTFKFNCREKIRQSIRKVKYRASRYLTLFSCNKLMCSCKNEAHVANYCNYKLSRDIEKNPDPSTYNKTTVTPYSQGNEVVFGQNAGQQCVGMSLRSLIYRGIDRIKVGIVLRQVTLQKGHLCATTERGQKNTSSQYICIEF